MTQSELAIAIYRAIKESGATDAQAENIMSLICQYIKKRESRQDACREGER